MHACQLNIHPVQFIPKDKYLCSEDHQYHMSMASECNLSPSDAHPETMDFLSLAWCNFAVQSLQPEPQHGSVVLVDNPMKQLEPGSPKVHSAVSQAV